MDPATEATHSAAIEPNTDFTSYETPCCRTVGFVPGHGLRAACIRAYRIRLGTDHGVYLRGYLSARLLAMC